MRRKSPIPNEESPAGVSDRSPFCSGNTSSRSSGSGSATPGASAAAPPDGEPVSCAAASEGSMRNRISAGTASGRNRVFRFSSQFSDVEASGQITHPLHGGHDFGDPYAEVFVYHHHFA